MGQRGLFFPLSAAVLRAVHRMGKVSWLLSLVLALLVVGCSSQNSSGSSTPSTTPTVSANEYQNPVIQTDFADPSILQVGSTWYAYATNGNGKNIQAASSTDLVHWTLLPDAMPKIASWAQPVSSYIWAPDVIQLGNQYVMYYVARDNVSNRQCVGAATSSNPAGPFVDSSNQALVCQSSQGGTIDPYPLLDGQTLYLYVKNDGNCCQLPTYIWVQQLTSDGLHVVGSPKSLIHNDHAWEGSVIEAPSMYKHNGRYYLFFSANDYSGSQYAIGYATCQTATGPCTQAPENPILASNLNQNPQLIGPGGQSVFTVGNQTWMVYHSWNESGGIQGTSRYMWLSRINWVNNKPQVRQPTSGPQPLPPT
jgi:beta-xylosidase